MLTVDIPEETPAASARAAPAAAVTLEALGISKRRIGFWLAGFILVTFLALPLLSRVSPVIEDRQARSSFNMSEWLSPGALSAGHGLTGGKCSICHQRAFDPVGDAACTQCHQGMAAHLTVDHLHTETVKAARCTDCHALHQDKAEAVKDSTAQCLGCHETLGAPMNAATDFAGAHPVFSLAILQGAETILARPDGGALPAEKSGLKFSHQAHLSPKGISTPEGDTVLNCGSCHRLEESGRHFARIEMKLTCQQSRCHTLRFDEPVFGVAAHGSEREVMGKVRDFYLRKLAETTARGNQSCESATKSGTALQQSLACADILARKHAGESLFRTTGAKLKCALCHDIGETGKLDVPWKVAPVRIQRDWQPKAVFDHRRHDTLGCTDCHDKNTSKTSDDIAFPRIEKCRECHAGGQGEKGKVASSCESCHRFHRRER